MAIDAPITGAPTRAPVILSRQDRAVITRQIETLIELLDHADGDTDLEPELDTGADDQGEPGSWAENGEGGLHAYGDDDNEPEDWSQVRRHRERLRRTRCNRVGHGGRLARWSTWQLRSEAAKAVQAVRPW